MKQEKGNGFLLSILLVLVAVSVYNINAVKSGYTDSYLKGLIITILASLVVIGLTAIFLKPKKQKLSH